MFHEKQQSSLFAQDYSSSQSFIPQNEIAGWTQGLHGASKPITGLIIGREMRGIVTKDNGNIKIRVQSYYKITGNEQPLLKIPNAKPHDGWSGKEIEITEDLAPEYAYKLKYSPSTELSEGIPITIEKELSEILNLKKFKEAAA